MMERRELPVLGSGPESLPMDRRQALKVMAIVAAAPGLTSCQSPERTTDAPIVLGSGASPGPAGTSWDPDLLSPVVPWQRTLTRDELESLAALCDVIIPADDRSPAASELGAHDFIDEWASAPYPGNQRDRVTVRGGLVWLDREAAGRFGDDLRFRDLDAEQKQAICDDICYLPDAAPENEAAAHFFDRVRDLAASAFWTTTEGMEDLEYVGNVPLARWDPPPPEVLRHLGLA
jgi:gluconate 2-dehydrogenase gamma chain